MNSSSVVKGNKRKNLTNQDLILNFKADGSVMFSIFIWVSFNLNVKLSNQTKPTLNIPIIR